MRLLAVGLLVCVVATIATPVSDIGSGRNQLYGGGGRGIPYGIGGQDGSRDREYGRDRTEDKMVGIDVNVVERDRTRDREYGVDRDRFNSGWGAGGRQPQYGRPYGI